MAARAPRHRTSHRPWRTAYITNSERGAIAAAVQGCPWVDNDFHLTRRGKAWGNDHGAPSRFWFAKGDRMEWHLAEDVFNRRRTVGGHTYHIRNMRETFEDNHRHGRNTEVEVKDVRPWNTPGILDAAFARMAAHAQAVYGDNWRQHVLVKVLTNLGGGEGYALQICAAAHAHNIPTMILARGRARFHTYAGHPEVTWVRGSAVIR